MPAVITSKGTWYVYVAVFGFKTGRYFNGIRGSKWRWNNRRKTFRTRYTKNTTGKFLGTLPVKLPVIFFFWKTQILKKFYRFEVWQTWSKILLNYINYFPTDRNTNVFRNFILQSHKTMDLTLRKHSLLILRNHEWVIIDNSWIINESWWPTMTTSSVYFSKWRHDDVMMTSWWRHVGIFHNSVLLSLISFGEFLQFSTFSLAPLSF